MGRARERRAALGPVLLGLVALASLGLDAGCFCGPSAPRMMGCRGAGTDFSGITDVRIVGAGVVRGFQGGSHFQFEIEADGTSLPTCVAQRSELLAGGTVQSVVDAPVQASVSGRSLLTSPILHFDGYGGADTLRVETLGRVLVLDLATLVDAGTDAGAGDAGLDAGVLRDAGPEDAGLDAGGLDAGGGRRGARRRRSRRRRRRRGHGRG
ncbi:MAG: hypothetical protein M5U28_15795 [Sandaracinaceae bacterium]|nr:hypothetical protein [Sandaracinaceae bacterium]